MPAAVPVRMRRTGTGTGRVAAARRRATTARAANSVATASAVNDESAPSVGTRDNPAPAQNVLKTVSTPQEYCAPAVVAQG